MYFIKSAILLLAVLFSFNKTFAQKVLTFSIEKTSYPDTSDNFLNAKNSKFQYYGRFENTNSAFQRFWSSGVYIKAKFEGDKCIIFLNDQVLYGKVHNYIEIVIDGNPHRLQTQFANNEIHVLGLEKGNHTLLICKDTETGNGYLEFAGIVCEKLLSLPPKPSVLIEFIGNSITCGYGNDNSEIACGKGEWYDQHNAYMAYGPLTARALNAQWVISAVSGIGMIHSCCGMKIVMPQVFDKIDMREDSVSYHFGQYTPDIVTICLGQNDGIQDSSDFCSAYVSFVKMIRSKYAHAKIILLSSPMADAKLRSVLKNYLSSISAYFQKNNDKNIYQYFFEKQYTGGCDFHPTIKEHKEIAVQLINFIKENKLINP